MKWPVYVDKHKGNTQASVLNAELDMYFGRFLGRAS